MATQTKTGTRTSKPKITAEQIQSAYVKYVLTEGKLPASVFAFADMNGMQESDFYTFFSSFEALEEGLWTGMMDRTIASIKADSNFEAFSAREKLLSFYFTHLEILKERRSFAAMQWPKFKMQPRTPKQLEGYKKSFMAFAKEIVVEGIEKQEIKERQYISERYDKAFWLQLAFVVNYWTGDSSKDFEQSDAAVEKAVNLSFQLLGDSTLDSVVDFAKFLWQSK
jgi:hypothetical protein